MRSNPNSTIAASPMLDKSLVNAYGGPVHTHLLHYICPVQVALSSCHIGDKPPCGRSSPMSHTLPRLVLRYAQTNCAGQEERPVAPHCRRSAARFTLTLCSGRCPCPLPAVRGQRGVNTLSDAPPTAPDVDVPLRCGYVRRAQSAQESVSPAVIGSLWTAVARAHTLSPLQVGGGLLRRADTRLRPLQKPMLNKLSGNVYGSPVHTLASQSLAPLPTFHCTSTSPNHKSRARRVQSQARLNSAEP